jgi:DNA-3-methyladenine glycosylase I
VPGESEVGGDGVRRCAWSTSAADYIAYHDHEWGFPVDDDRLLFEKLILEGFQAGLSWLTILRKRPAFRDVFAGFDHQVVATFGAADVDRLLGDARIIRHRGKIESTINNARRAVALTVEFGSLGSFFWGFEPESRSPRSASTSLESQAMSAALKQRGFTFVGPTTAYAFMQAMGIVDDHVEDCAARAEAEAARLRFVPPA